MGGSNPSASMTEEPRRGLLHRRLASAPLVESQQEEPGNREEGAYRGVPCASDNPHLVVLQPMNLQLPSRAGSASCSHLHNEQQQPVSKELREGASSFS